MTANSSFTVITGSYVSSEEARADLSKLDDLNFEQRFGAYDAAIIVTDAWGQVRVEAHISRQASDTVVGPLDDAFTALFGGPFIGGAAPPLPNDPRVPHKELLRIGDAIGPSSVRTIALVLAQQQLDPAEVLPKADAVEMTSIESTGENLQGLASVITDVMRKWRKEPSRKT